MWALEGALKLKEISYIHAEGLPSSEMKHGHIALIDTLIPVVFLISNKDPYYNKILSNMQEIKSRKGSIITVTNSNDEEIEKMYDVVFYTQDCSFDIFPFLAVVILQLISYHIAKLRDCPIDTQRNLAKCVTVE